MLVTNFVEEFRRWRVLGEKAMAQVPDDALNTAPARDSNSIAVIAHHVGGNLASRFTDFLTTDGEKPWRNRDGEFDETPQSRADVEAIWKKGFDTVARELGALSDADLARTVKIRGVDLTVHEALCRSLAHIANHVGQIILLAKMLSGPNWKTLSIPRGASQEYNSKATAEKASAHVDALQQRRS